MKGGNGVGTSELTYDGLGNIRSYDQSLLDRELSYHYSDSTNRLIAVEGAGPAYDAFTYDARGNVIDNGTRTFTYNHANQLVQSGDIRYRYDGHSRRVMETNNGSHRYSFYRLDGTLVYRETEAGSINYVYLGDKLIAKDGYIPEDSGTQHYQPFGESIEGAVDDVGYTGHRFDADTGLVYMQARYYDPVIGRFYSNDPVGWTPKNPVMSFNRYLYVNNNPYKYTDPDGEFLWGAIIGAGIELGAQLATGQNVDWSDVAIAGAVGAVTGGFAGRAATQALKGAITASKAVKQTAAVSAVASGAGSVAQDVANGKDISVGNAVVSSATGAAGGALGGKIANKFASKLDAMSNAGGISAQISGTTRSAIVGTTAGQTTSTTTGLANKAGDLAISVADKKIKEELN